MSQSERVPQAMQETFNAIGLETDSFCDQRLDGEYKKMVRLALAALCRKRPSPLLKGKDKTWAAGVVHAVGMVNFLFDPSQKPHCKATEIYDHFGVSTSTGHSKSKTVQQALDMYQMSAEWTLPSKLDQNPLVWMLQVNGMMVDVRHMPMEVQAMALAQGLIPYIPGQDAG